MAALAGDHQVVVVTHLAQVAALADRQVHVTKAVVDAVTVASARTLDAGQRVEEIARMLSGAPESSAAREHAAELLAAEVPVHRQDA